MNGSCENWRAVGHRLRVARIVLGITEEQAAADFGVSLQTYRRYEAEARQRGRGWGHCRLRRIVGFAERYDVDLDWLVKARRAGSKIT
jgi:transcriptional regulator with XRE-family HTH domain